MSYPRQASVADRLQEEAMDQLHDVKDRSWSRIEREWRRTRVDLRRAILDTYHTWFPNGTWTLLGLRSSGAIHELTHHLSSRIAAFSQGSWAVAKESINNLYKLSILRHAWVLDQTTPPSFKIRIPHRLKLIEARSAVSFYKGDAATQKLGERWNAWSDAYRTALLNNLQMNAMNEGSPSDAADEVDATRANTPQSGLLDAYQRIFDFEAVAAMNEAITTVNQVNEEAEVEQIWETRRDLKVCDDCDANEGLTEDEVDGWIPLHPNCILPDQKVVCSDAVAGIKAFYDGPCIEITSASGRRLSITENHPVLTRRGLILAKDLRESDDLICCADPKRIASMIGQDKDNGPTRIEEKFESLYRTSSQLRTTIQASAMDFHGDGRFMNGYVDIIRTDSQLRGCSYPEILKMSKQIHLMFTYMQPFSLSGNGARLFRQEAPFTSTRRGPGRLHQSAAGDAGQMSPSHPIVSSVAPARSKMSLRRPAATLIERDEVISHNERFSESAEDYAAFPKNPLNDMAIRAERARQFVRRFPSLITADKIARIRKFNFRGHVYDLQAKAYSLFSVDGVQVGNCHCYWRIVPKSWADLLRSGDDEDYRLAVEMDARGLVPNAMVIRDESGKLAGYDVVDFGDWVNDKFRAIGTY